MSSIVVASLVAEGLFTVHSVIVGRLNEEYQREQDRQEKKRQDDVKAREAKSRRAYEVCMHKLTNRANN